MEVEGSPNLSDQATDVDETQEAFADEPLADAEWLECRKQKERRRKSNRKSYRNDSTEVVRTHRRILGGFPMTKSTHFFLLLCFLGSLLP